MKFIYILIFVLPAETVLPPSPARNHKYDCYMRGRSSKYSGKKRSTGSGIACQYWNSDVHHHSRYPDLPSNYCRDPNNRGFPWCYTEDPLIEWMDCGIPECPGNNPISCRDLKNRGRNKDGEYDIWPPKLPYQKIRVFCYDMKNNPTEFFMFKELNYGSTQPNICPGLKKPPGLEVPPYGRTVYKKIRLDIYAMELEFTDTQFAEVYNSLVPFGQAADCYADHERVDKYRTDCYPVGQFHIDLRNTGFRFGRTIVRDFETFGNSSFKMVRPQNNSKYIQYVHIECGGFCGGCRPKKNIRIYTIETNGGWTNWQPIFPCGFQCYPHEMTKTLYRMCANPPQTGNGRACPGGRWKRARICVTGCPVDGGWGLWKTNMTTCSVSCGSGTVQITKYRMCDKPKPRFGGKYCIGRNQYTYTEDCSIPCPVDAGWGEWILSSGHCSVTCGAGGKQTSHYYRECDNPLPSYHGHWCEGPRTKDEKTTDCQSGIPCPVHGKWGDWKKEKVEDCSVTCGDLSGIRRVIDVRECNNPKPHLGAECNGNNIRSYSESCTANRSCAVDGDWGSWLMLSRSDCSSTCGEAGVESVSFKRSCDNPSPQLGGRQCFGEDSKNYTQECLSGVFCEVSEAFEQGSGSGFSGEGSGSSGEGSGLYSGDGGWSPWEKFFEQTCTSDCTRDILYRRNCLNEDCEGKLTILITEACEGDHCNAVAEKESALSVVHKYLLYTGALMFFLSFWAIYLMTKQPPQNKSGIFEIIEIQNRGISRSLVKMY